jgi:fatty acid desaturase
MARRLPSWTQPFLTWLTAKPAPGESAVPTSPLAYVVQACALTLCGAAVSGATLALSRMDQPAFWPLLFAGLLATTSGLGIFQVVVFHHCAHGTVFSTRARNRTVGRVISAVLLFKHFDKYQKEHMLHHSANKLFTDDDEFTDFIIGICRLAPGMSRRQLWRRLLTDLASPVFHGRFLLKRIRGGLLSHERSHNLIGLSAWLALVSAADLAHGFGILLVAWVLPVTVLLQIATVFRILCEHRVPPVEVIRRRGQELVCQATAGVFPGANPPSTRHNIFAWVGWWLNMLTIQIFVRLFVLVGDAPCHDFHHRRPASKKWTDYIHGRQSDLDAGCPGFPLNYVDSWGLFRAIDQNFAAMARAPADLITTTH